MDLTQTYLCIHPHWFWPIPLSYPTTTGDFFTFSHSVTHALVFSMEYKEAQHPLISSSHYVYNFRNARLIYLLILNCIINNLIFETFSRMSVLSSCPLALFTSRIILGAYSRKTTLRGYVFSGSCKQDFLSLPSICTSIPMWNRTFTDQWTEQTTAASLVLAQIRSCDLCHLQGLVKAMIHAWATQSIWGRQHSLSWNFLLEFYRAQENWASETNPLPFSDHCLHSII